MGRVCLGIIFNHKYNKNVEIIESIYKDRFKNVYYIIPFNTEKIQGVKQDKKS